MARNKQKFLITLLILVMQIFALPLAFAQGDDDVPTGESLEETTRRDTLLPDTDKSTAECEEYFHNVASAELEPRIRERNLESIDILACGIKTGNVKLWMLPYYVRYILEFVLGIAGLISVAGIVYGGYLYLFAKVTDDPEKGKKAILYGIVGFVISLLAWAFVNIILSLFT